MIEINLNNVENFFYENSNILSENENLKIFYNQWFFSKINSSFRNIGKQALIDFLNNIKLEDINYLEKKIGKEIILNNNFNKNVINESFDLNENYDFLNSYNFSIFRKDDKLKITYWR